MKVLKYSAVALFCLVTLVTTAFASHTCGAGVNAANACYIDNTATGCGGGGCSDANDGNTKATAWVHDHDMVTATGNAASHVPAPDDHFIHIGGGVWGKANFIGTWTFAHSGTAGHPITFGVDQTWHTGGAWSRPIFDCGLDPLCNPGATNRGTMWMAGGHDIVIDNIEFKGLFVGTDSTVSTTTTAGITGNSIVAQTVPVASVAGMTTNGYVTVNGAELVQISSINSPPGTITGVFPTSHASGVTVTGMAPSEVHYVFVQDVNVEIKNCYFHGWGHDTNPPYVNSGLLAGYLGGGGSGIAGSNFHDNVFDGADTSQDMMEAINNAERAENNIFRYVVCALCGRFNVYGNALAEHIVTNYTNTNNLPATPPHADGFMIYFPLTGTTTIGYNIVVRDSATASGVPMFWVKATGYSAACTNIINCTDYVFNSVIVGGASGPQNTIAYAGHPSDGCFAGTLKAYSNTADSDTLPVLGNSESSGADCGGLTRGTVNYANTHGITSGATWCDGTGVTCVNDGGAGITSSLKQTVAQATVSPGGYNLISATNAYSPSSASASGIGIAGYVSQTTYCGEVTAIDATAGAACAKDTTYGPAYDATNHKVNGYNRTAVTRVSNSAGAYDNVSGSGGSSLVVSGVTANPGVTIK